MLKKVTPSLKEQTLTNMTQGHGYQPPPVEPPQVWAPYFFPYSFPYLFLRDSARLRLLNGQLEDYLNYLGLCVVLIQSLI